MGKSDPLAGYETFFFAAQRLKLTAGRLRQLAIAGKLPAARKIGRDWYLPRDYRRG